MEGPHGTTGHGRRSCPGRETAARRETRDRKKDSGQRSSIPRSHREQHGRDPLCDAAGGQLYVSPSITRVLGYAPEELFGRNALDFFHPEDRERGWNMLRAITATPGNTANNVFRRRHKDGTWRWTECSAHNLLHDPAVQAVVINFHDITARKQAEDLKEVDRRKNEFLATLATNCATHWPRSSTPLN